MEREIKVVIIERLKNRLSEWLDERQKEVMK